MSEKKDDFAEYIILIFASLYFIIFYYFAHKSQNNLSGTFHGLNYNIFVFAVSILVFFISSLIIFFFLKKKKVVDVSTRKNLNIISILYAVCFIIFLISIYLLELTSYNGVDWCQSAVPKNKVNKGIFFVIIAIILFCSNYLISVCSKRPYFLNLATSHIYAASSNSIK